MKATVKARCKSLWLSLGYTATMPPTAAILISRSICLDAKWMVIIFIGIELLTGITGTQMGVAHFAHLGGALFGWLTILYWKKRGKLYRY